MYVLDTKLRNTTKGTANPGVVAWAAAVPASSQFMSATTLMALELGA